MDKQTLKELEELFSFAPPEDLMRSLHVVFFAYLINNNEAYPQDHRMIVEDFYFLMNFLDKAGRNRKYQDRALLPSSTQ